MISDHQYSLERYLEKIGCPDIKENPQPNKSNLIKILKSHLLTVPYQNVHTLFRKTKEQAFPLDINSLFFRLIIQKQGGMCYETSELLRYALKDLNYDVYPQRSYVLNGGLYNTGLICSHNFLVVKIDSEEFIVDVGFGKNHSSGLIPFYRELEINEFSTGRGETFQLLRVESQCYEISIFIKGTWMTCFRFYSNDIYENIEEGVKRDYINVLGSELSIASSRIVISKVKQDCKIAYQFANSKFLYIYTNTQRYQSQIERLVREIQKDEFLDGVASIVGMEISEEIGYMNL